MDGAEFLRDLPGIAGLVEFGAEVVGHGEGADVADAHLVHQRHHGARIDAPGEEDAEGDVAAELEADRVAQDADGPTHAPLLALLLMAGLQVPVLADARPLPADRPAPAGLEPPDLLEERAHGG